MLYCCGPLITAAEVILKTLKKAHNQALRLIPGYGEPHLSADERKTKRWSYNGLLVTVALKLEQRRNSQLALSDITDWPGIEAVARSSNKGETVDSGTLNIPDWPRIEAVAESYLEERRNSGQWHSSTRLAKNRSHC
ncbi:unnamed protein product [Rodentolepis nana]|uniref:Transposase n=1 Tax=Rodentolepis nana TaxID=102285 RepID=A0A0R3TA32_RODNA|nr:unnamed protein product [Rodentolepis nana]